MNLKYFSLYRWTFEEMRGAMRFVYAYIATFSGSGKSCGASQAYIAERLRISERTVKRCIKRLTESGYIETTRAGKRKERNAYTVNETRAAERLRVWQIRNSTALHTMPDALRVYDCMIEAYGASTECLLIANLYQLQTYAERTDTAFSAGVQYGQKALATMCGCGISQLKDAIKRLESAGIIEKFAPNITWKKSRLAYYLNEQPEMSLVNCGKLETGANSAELPTLTAGNVTCKPNEQPEMSLVNGIEQPEMSPNEYISFMNPLCVMNPALDSAARAPETGVENRDFSTIPDFSESETETATENESGNQSAESDIFASIIAESEAMQNQTEPESKESGETRPGNQSAGIRAPESDANSGYRESVKAFFALCEAEGIKKGE